MNIEELRKKAEAAWEGCHHCDENDKNMWVNGYITGALGNQPELPSDEEILKVALEKTNNINEQILFNNGAVYICKLIEGGNK